MVMKYEIIAHSLNSLLYVYAQEYRSDIERNTKMLLFWPHSKLSVVREI